MKTGEQISFHDIKHSMFGILLKLCLNIGVIQISLLNNMLLISRMRIV
ncbi:hypothetical protein ACV56Z_01750 [Staphylococcus aureus]